MSDKANSLRANLLAELMDALDEADIFDPKAYIHVTADGPVIVIVDKDADMMIIRLNVQVVEDDNDKIRWSLLMNAWPEWGERT